MLKVTLRRTIRIRVEFGDKSRALIHPVAFRTANDQRLEAFSFAVRATAASAQDSRRGRPTNWTGTPISAPSVHRPYAPRSLSQPITRSSTGRYPSIAELSRCPPGPLDARSRGRGPLISASASRSSRCPAYRRNVMFSCWRSQDRQPPPRSKPGSRKAWDRRLKPVPPIISAPVCWPRRISDYPSDLLRNCNDVLCEVSKRP